MSLDRRCRKYKAKEYGWTHLDRCIFINWTEKGNSTWQRECNENSIHFMQCRNQYSKFWKVRKSEDKVASEHVWVAEGTWWLWSLCQHSNLTLCVIHQRESQTCGQKYWGLFKNKTNTHTHTQKDNTKPLCIIWHLKKGKDLQPLLNMFLVATQMVCLKQILL